jgi:XRE family transcriptional regulator, regulator of sulfur utilization
VPEPPGGRPALDDPAGDVGARVRALRAERGLSLSELARRAGIGKATLSGLEAGTRNPTLETLYAVTSALGLPLTALVAGPGPVRGAAAEMELLRVFDDAAAVYELYRMHLPAGGEQHSPAHHTGVTEHVTVFAGVLEAGPGEDPRRAGPGQYAEWAADRPHGYRAVGPDDVRASLLIRYPR